jgi:hypothetical protein
MAVVSYPGVYIEEKPSGVRTITGVATSIAAFIGAARMGPLDDPVPIRGFADFERRFGGLDVSSALGYAVRDFFANGGGEAIVVRVARNATRATLSLPAPDNKSTDLVAASEGQWGKDIKADVDQDTRPGDNSLFNLRIKLPDGRSERFLNLSVDPTKPRYAPLVLEQQSNLVAVAKDDSGKWKVSPSRPNAGTDIAATGGGNGDPLTEAEYLGSESKKTGIYALADADLLNLLCIPPPTRDGETPTKVYQTAAKFCRDHRALLLIDAPRALKLDNPQATLDGLGVGEPDSQYAALYFPRLLNDDPLREGQFDYPPSGAVAGVMARTDTRRGVWKAPAGTDAGINGIQGFSVPLTDDENGDLNPLGINCLRAFPGYGRVVWGARTLAGSDRNASEWKYVPVRRLALYIEESLYRGTKWAVFEPNDEPLWSQLRLNIGAFMHNLFRSQAFQGTTPREAYFVKVDKETTTQNDINLGVVNIVVGFAPLKPAEFVVIQLQQMAGQIAT